MLSTGISGSATLGEQRPDGLHGEAAAASHPTARPDRCAVGAAFSASNVTQVLGVHAAGRPCQGVKVAPPGLVRVAAARSSSMRADQRGASSAEPRGAMAAACIALIDPHRRAEQLGAEAPQAVEAPA